MAEEKVEGVSFGAIVSTIGAILIAVGVAWIIAINWSSMPAILKIMILFFFTVTSYVVGVVLRTEGYGKIGESLLLLGAILYGLSIILIAQIFSTSESIQGFAYLALLAWVGTLFSAYIFTSKNTLFLGLVEFLVWISIQYVALIDNDLSIGILTVIYLFLGVAFYGLTQIHKCSDHIFAETFRWFTALYVLLLTYIISFQTLLPYLWPKDVSISIGSVVLLLALAILSIALATWGILTALNNNKLTIKEAGGFFIIVGLYLMIITLASLTTPPSGYYGFGGQLSVGLWMLWLFDNIIFIFAILAVIGYGTRYNSPGLINLAIAFFALDVITRYIGFIMDFGGQLGFAVVAIFGGVLLIAGGWGIEHWRRGLIVKSQDKKNTEYSIY